MNGSFENLHTVTVTKLTATSVEKSPVNRDVTEWTATLTNILGVYTALDVTNSQITFTSLSNGVKLVYNHNGNAEQYAGRAVGAHGTFIEILAKGNLRPHNHIFLPISPAHFKQCIGNLSERAMLGGFHQFYKHVVILNGRLL